MRVALVCLVLVALAASAIAQHESSTSVEVHVVNDNNVHSSGNGGRSVMINGQAVNGHVTDEHAYDGHTSAIDHADEHEHEHEEHEHEFEHEHEHEEHEHEHEHEEHEHEEHSEAKLESESALEKEEAQEHAELASLPTNKMDFASLQLAVDKGLATAERDTAAAKTNTDQGETGTSDGKCPSCHQAVEDVEKLLTTQTRVAVTAADKQKLDENHKRLTAVKQALNEVEQQAESIHKVKQQLHDGEAAKNAAASEADKDPKAAEQLIDKADAELHGAEDELHREELRTQDPAEKLQLAQKEQRIHNDLLRMNRLKAKVEQRLRR